MDDFGIEFQLGFLIFFWGIFHSWVLGFGGLRLEIQFADFPFSQTGGLESGNFLANSENGWSLGNPEIPDWENSR